MQLLESSTFTKQLVSIYRIVCNFSITEITTFRRNNIIIDSFNWVGIIYK